LTIFLIDLRKVVSRRVIKVSTPVYIAVLFVLAVALYVRKKK